MKRPSGNGAAIRRVLYVCGLTAALLSVGSTLAAARQIPIRSCAAAAAGGEQSTSTGWYGTRSAFWETVDDCPNGLSFARKPLSVVPERGVWKYFPGPVTTEIRFRVEGTNDPGAGVRYVVGSCNTRFCADIAELPARSRLDPPQFLDYKLPYSDAVFFAAACESATCEPSPDFKLSDFVVAVDDSVHPDVHFHHDLGDGRLVEKSRGWVSAANAIDAISLTDRLTGVHDARVLIDGVELPDAAFTCAVNSDDEFLALSLCPRDLKFLSDVRALTHDGDKWHRIEIEVTDTAGNRIGPEIAWSEVDDSPPPPPANLSITGLGGSTWTTRSQLSASWTNAGENLPDNENSGLAKSWLDIDPLEGQTADPPAKSGSVKNSGSVSLPGEGLWKISAWLEDAVGNVGAPSTVTIGRDIDPPTPPVMDEHGWINRRDLEKGGAQEWAAGPASPQNESGICGFAAEINSSFESDPIPEPNVPAGIPEMRIPRELPSGTYYAHVRSISCAGMPSVTTTVPVRVDRDPPAREIFPAGRGGWLQAPIGVRLLATDTNSGVSRIEYELDGEPTRSAASADVTVGIGDGEHRIAMRAYDAAGNASSTSDEKFRVDSSPPAAYFLPFDLGDPSKVKAVVSDRVSGIDSAQVQIRSLGAGSAWKSIDTRLDSNGTGRDVTLVASIDDAELAEGLYELRVAARDVAGNSNLTGGAASAVRVIALPLRTGSSITSAIALERSRCVKTTGIRCRQVPYVDRRAAKSRLETDFGTDAVAVGDLHDGDGSPLMGRTVSIYGAVGAEPARLLGSCLTKTDGSYEFRLPPGPSLHLTARFDGDAYARPSRSQSELGVRATVSFRTDKKRVRWGRSVSFRGRLKSGGQHVEARGKEIRVELVDAGTPMVIPGRTTPDGSFSIPFVFRRAVARPVTYRFRLLVPYERGWPFLPGRSRRIAVTVLPR